MTTWTRPFGPASLQIDAELEIAKITASLTAYLAHSKRRGVVVALSGGNRLEHGGGRSAWPPSARSGSSGCTCRSGSRRPRPSC